VTKVTLTIETDKDEDPRQALARFLGIDPDKVVPGPNGGGTEWTPEDFTGFWNGLTADAKTLLGEIAKKPDSCSAGDIEKALGWSGLHLGGRLSSVGHQMRRFPGRPRPVNWDASAGGYAMTRRIADWVRRLIANQKIV
jgi:hypothetical protein